ncbi:MAG: GxxExxY protein, partial [Sedimentisphaerales bacterium]|nr:GxxExxY protein [Sedimentisphaerales bacterium]
NIEPSMQVPVKREKILYSEECYAIQGATFEVYREIGCGFLEAVYQECLIREFKLRRIPFVSQPELKIIYKEELIDQTYKPDFICFDKIIVELKATKAILDEHKAQIFNYLKASGFKLGLLINFGHCPKVEVVRIIL